jgi:hypothetical protein
VRSGQEAATLVADTRPMGRRAPTAAPPGRVRAAARGRTELRASRCTPTETRRGQQATACDGGRLAPASRILRTVPGKGPGGSTRPLKVCNGSCTHSSGSSGNSNGWVNEFLLVMKPCARDVNRAFRVRSRPTLSTHRNCVFIDRPYDRRQAMRRTAARGTANAELESRYRKLNLG